MPKQITIKKPQTNSDFIVICYQWFQSDQFLK